MTKPITHTILILDQSGSMEITKAQTVQGFNEKIQQARIANESGEQEVFVSLITFNGDVYEHFWCCPATEISLATVEQYECGGSTAFRDALGYAIEKMLATTDSDNPNVSYFVEMISDGEENASKHFTVYDSKLQVLIDKVQATKRWTITYMGCDKKYVEKVAKETHIPLANCAVWRNDTAEFAMRGMIGSSASGGGYYKLRAKGQTCSANVHNVEACCLTDYSDTSDNTIINTDALNIAKAVDNNILNTMNVVKDSIVNNVASTTTPFNNHCPVSWTSSC